MPLGMKSYLQASKTGAFKSPGLWQNVGWYEGIGLNHGNSYRRFVKDWMLIATNTTG